MANKVVKELQINVSIKNGKLVIDNVDQLKKSLLGIETAQTRVAKSTADVANKNKNATKSFSDQARASSSLVRSYAIIAANAFALSRAFEILKRNADLTIIERSAEQLSRSTGTNFAKVAEDMKAITGGALNIKDAFTAANLGLSGGATVQQLEQITEVATKAANTLGRNVPEAVNRMIQAVIKGEPELVDEFGIILRVKEATDEYALSIGKVASELTTLERQQAIINQLIDQGTRKFSEVSIEVNPYQKLQTAFSELIDTLLKFISLPLGVVVGALADNIGLLLAALGTVASFLTKQLVPSAKDFGATFNKSLKSIEVQAQKTFTGLEKNVNKFQKIAQKLDVRRTRKQAPAALATAEREIEKAIAQSNSGVLQRATQGLKGTRLIETVEDVLNRDALDNAEKEFDKTTGNIKARAVKIGGETTRIFDKTTREIQTSLSKMAKGVAGSTKEAASAVSIASINIAKSMDLIRNSALRAKQVVISSSIEMIKGISAVSNAATFGQAFTAFKDIGRNFEDIGSSSTRAGKAVNFVAKSASQAAGGIALLGRGLAKVVSAFSFWGVILLIAYEALKSVADAMGLIDHEANAAEKVIDDLTESFKELSDSTTDVLDRFNSASTGIEELVNKYTALNNKIGEVNKAILDSGKALQKVSGRGVLRSIAGFIGPDFLISASDAEKAVGLIIKQLDELERASGEEVVIPLVIEGEETRLRDILGDQELLDNVKVREQIYSELIKATKEVGDASLETTGAIQDMAKAAKELNDLSTGILTDFKNSLASSQEVDNLIALQKGFEELTKAGQPAAVTFANFASQLNSMRRASLGITESQVDQANGIVSITKLIEDLNKELESTEAQQDILKKFAIENEGVESIESFVDKVKELADTDFTKTGLEAIFSFFTSDKAKVMENNIAGIVAAAASDPLSTATNNLDSVEKALEDQLQSVMAIERAEATASARKITVTKQLEAARIAQSKGIEGATARVFELERASLGVTLDILKADKRRLELKKSQAKGTDERLLTLVLEGKTKEIAATESLIAIKSAQFSFEKANLIELRDASSNLAKEQDIIIANRIANIKDLKAIEDNTFFTEERRTGALKERLSLEGELLASKIKESEQSLKTLQFNVDLAREDNNRKHTLSAVLAVAKEEGNLSNLKLQQEMLITSQIEDSLKFRREEAALLQRTVDLERNREELLLSIAGNKDASPELRQRALDKGIETQKEANRLATSIADENIKIAQSLVDKTSKQTDSLALSEAELGLREAIFEKGVVLNTQLDEQLEKRKAINDLQKKLVDQGQGSFDKALAESLAIASEEFSRGLVDSVTIAANVIMTTIDTTVDSLVDNLKSFAEGNISAGDAIVNILQDVSKSVADIVEEQLKDQFKAFIKESLFGENSPVEESNNLLTSIDKNIAALVNVSGGAASAAVPTSAAGLINISGSISSFGSGLADLFSTEIEPEVKLASGGIVTSPTTALIGEAGPEAVIPLQGGSLPVQISETTSVAAVKALVTVGEQTQQQTANTEIIIQKLKDIDNSINDGFTELTNLLVSNTSSSQIDKDSSSTNTINAIIAGVGLLGSLAGAFSGSFSSSDTTSSTAGFQGTTGQIDTGSFLTQDSLNFKAKGGVLSRGIRALAEGGVTSSPEIGIIGEGENNEAVVPLPDNRNIPVVLMNEDGEPAGRGNSPMVNITMNISGGGGNSNNFNKSANQIALETARVVQRSLKRDD